MYVHTVHQVAFYECRHIQWMHTHRRAHMYMYVHILMYFDMFSYIYVRMSPQVKQHEFRENFRRTAPFMFKATKVYARLNKVLMICVNSCKWNFVHLPSCWVYVIRYVAMVCLWGLEIFWYVQVPIIYILSIGIEMIYFICSMRKCICKLYRTVCTVAQPTHCSLGMYCSTANPLFTWYVL